MELFVKLFEVKREEDLKHVIEQVYACVVEFKHIVQVLQGLMNLDKNSGVSEVIECLMQKFR